MKVSPHIVNRNTALVYTGAAILIVVVGIRTLIQTMDEGLGLMSFVTIGSLGIEFSLLLLYAWTIYSQPVEEKIAVHKDGVDLGPLSDGLKKFTKAIDSTVEKINASRNESIEDLIKQIEALSIMNEKNSAALDAQISNFSETVANSLAEFRVAGENIVTVGDSLAKCTNSLVELGSSIDSMANDQLRNKIQEEIPKTLSAMIKSNA